MRLTLAFTIVPLLGLALGGLLPPVLGDLTLSRSARQLRVTLDITNGPIAPDGVRRSAILVNGAYPGPLIAARKGDKLLVTVNNRLTDNTMRRSTSVNFDGIFSSAANVYNEGTPFVTTCPIAPGRSYTYEVDLGQQTGTFWYHSQLDLQYQDGLRGPLIVYDPRDPLAHLYDVDDESTIIQIGDWWQQTTLALTPGFDATGSIPAADSMTINGAGRFNNGPAVPWPVINVVQGRRYRLRLISEAVRNGATFSVDKHPLTIIEVDGEATRPHRVNAIPLLPGMRYSVVLNANQKVDNYWINAPFTAGPSPENPRVNPLLTRAILRYKGARAADPTTPYAPSSNGTLVEADLRPLISEPAPEPDVSLSLNLRITLGAPIWNVNEVSYRSPTVPTLDRVLAGATRVADFNFTENTFVLPADAVVEVVFPPNTGIGAHPFHLHGNNFWLTKPSDAASENTQAPIKRDIAVVGSATGTTIRFRTDKAGPWFFHCHIMWHMRAGLATVLLANPDGVREEAKPTNAWRALCPIYNALPPALQ